VTITPSPLHIRAATASDYDALCALFREVDAQHSEHLPHLFRLPAGPPRDRGYILGLISDPCAGLFVAEIDGELVGLVNVLIRDTPDFPVFVPHRFAAVEDLVVGSSHRRRGIGRALLERAHEWARAQGAVRVQLTVYEFNQEALPFYRALGYETLRHALEMPL